MKVTNFESLIVYDKENGSFINSTENNFLKFFKSKSPNYFTAVISLFSWSYRTRCCYNIPECFSQSQLSYSFFFRSTVIQWNKFDTSEFKILKQNFWNMKVLAQAAPLTV